MKPWIEVARTHADVIAGTFVQSDFAADISQVVNGTAPEEYRDPEAFYARTYVTEGMKQLLVTVAKRLNGRGGDPVIELKTNFGGGKTHTLLAVYHLAKYEGKTAELSGIADVLKSAEVDDVPRAKVAVIDGNVLAPNEPVRQGGLSIRTLWGNLAYQLLGTDGYTRVAKSDASGTSPGKAIIEAILRDAGPCVILMDELVAYYRQFNVEGLAGGTFESNVSFAQALTEAVKSVPQAIMLVSLPSSETETVGTFGRIALETLEKTFGRVNAIWRPVSAQEGFEIVKRRLFEKIEDTAAVEETCQTFSGYYHEKRDSLPTDIQEGGYIDQMRRCYPIHPEVFARLYEDWSTLPNFQKTRGVLQYMAIVVNRLWEDGTKEPLILPASIPLCDAAVANKSTQFLPNGWSPIIDREIDGENAVPASLDATDARLGELRASVRVARTVFMGSAASSGDQAVRGIDEKRIFLGCAMPGQEISFYGDALKKMRERLQYLFHQNERYWYDTRPNLTRTMDEYKARQKDAQVRDCIEQTFKSRWGAPSGIAEVHVFADSREVPDDVTSGLRVVVLPMVAAYSPQTEKRTIDVARTFLDRCGTQPRMRKNRLVFLAAELVSITRLSDMCRTYLAWREIQSAISSGAINATQTDVAQVLSSERQSEQLLKGMIGEVFRYLIVPVAEGTNDVGFDVRKMQIPQSAQLGDVVRQTLENGQYIVREWAPKFLKTMLDQIYFKDSASEISTRKVWLDMASYCCFERLVSADVLCEAVRRGVVQKMFGYAREKELSGAYAGFAFGENPGMVGISDREQIIRDTVADAYEKKTAEDGNGDSGTGTTGGETGNGFGPGSGSSGGTGVTPNPSPATAAKRKFLGEVHLDTSKNVDAVSQIAEEVLSHLADKGAKVKVTITVEASSPNPFPPKLVRTVGENAHALQFKRAEFS